MATSWQLISCCSCLLVYLAIVLRMYINYNIICQLLFNFKIIRILYAAPTNGVQQLIHSVPDDRKLLELCRSYTLKTKHKAPPTENSLATSGGCFKRNTYCATALSWLNINCYYYCSLDRLYKLLYVVLDASICCPAMIAVKETLIHWLEPPSCFRTT